MAIAARVLTKPWMTDARLWVRCAAQLHVRCLPLHAPCRELHIHVFKYTWCFTASWSKLRNKLFIFSTNFCSSNLSLAQIKFFISISFMITIQKKSFEIENMIGLNKSCISNLRFNNYKNHNQSKITDIQIRFIQIDLLMPHQYIQQRQIIK